MTQTRRNSIIRKEQFSNGMRVGTVLHVSGRFPQNGKHSDCSKNTFMYVLKGSGMIAKNDSKAPLTIGNVLSLEQCDEYYLKGQFSLYVIHLHELRRTKTAN